MARERSRELLARLKETLWRCVEGLATLRDTHFLAFPRLAGVKEVVDSLSNQCELLLGRTAEKPNLSYGIASEFLAAAVELCGVLETLTAQWRRSRCLSGSEERAATVLLSKLELVNTLLPFGFDFPEDDLLNLERSHSRWRFLWSEVDFHRSSDLPALEAALGALMQKAALTSAALALGEDCASDAMRRILTGSGLLYYGLRQEEAMQEGKVSAAYPTVELTRLRLGIAESSIGAKVFDSMLAKVAVSERIYIPMVSSCVTETDMYSSLALPLSPRAAAESFTDTPIPSRPSVALRIISPFPVPLLHAEHSSGWALCCSRPTALDDPHVTDKVILHVHGGGWICMSAHAHESYTRKWALGAKALILSVDYRLSPEHKYPAALTDVWEAYIWILKYAKKHLGVDPKKVIIAGDSAGGNMALALALKALQERVRPPDGLLLTYPALNLDMKRPSPSYMLSFDDLLLSHGMMMLCDRSYIPDDANPGSDPLLSPLCASDELLRQLPPVRIMIGTKDPLIDDSWRLFERLKLLGNDVKMSVFEGFIHGVLNLDLPMGLPQAQEMVTTGQQYLKELLFLASAPH